MRRLKREAAVMTNCFVLLWCQHLTAPARRRPQRLERDQNNIRRTSTRSDDKDRCRSRSRLHARGGGWRWRPSKLLPSTTQPYPSRRTSSSSQRAIVPASLGATDRGGLLALELPIGE